MTIEERAKEKFPTIESPNWYYENEIYRPLFVEWCKEQRDEDLKAFERFLDKYTYSRTSAMQTHGGDL